MQETYYIKGYEITIALGDEMSEESVITILEKAVSFYETGMFESLEDAINLSYVLFLNESDIENKVAKKIEAKVAPALNFSPTDLGEKIQATIIKRLEARSQGQMEAQASYLKELNKNLQKSLAEVTKKTGEVVSRETIIEEIINNIPTPKTMSREDIAEIVREEVKKWKATKQQKGGGASTFKQLNDVPNAYNGFAGKVVKVKSTEDGLEFGEAATPLTDTDDLAEGATSLYYTDERVDDRVANLVTAGTNITVTYDDTAGTLTIDAADQGVNVDTRANILGTNTSGANGFSTDTREEYIEDGTDAWVHPINLIKDELGDNVLIGGQNFQPRKYNIDYISEINVANAKLINTRIGETNQVGTEGAIKIIDNNGVNEVQFYLNGAWRTVLSGVQIREDSAGIIEFFNEENSLWVDIHNGNSNELGNNGRPLLQEYEQSIGANPVRKIHSRAVYNGSWQPTGGKEGVATALVNKADVSDADFLGQLYKGEIVGITDGDPNSTDVIAMASADTDAPTALTYLPFPVSSAPASSTDTGIPGQYFVDASHRYDCYAADTWRRVSLLTF